MKRGNWDISHEPVVRSVCISLWMSLARIAVIAPIVLTLTACGSHKYLDEQEVLDRFAAHLKEGNLLAAKDLCWNADIIELKGTPALVFRSMAPINDTLNPGSQIYPSLWTQKDMIYQCKWILTKSCDKRELSVPICNIDDYYVVLTDRSVAIGFIKINNNPKICFIFSTKG